MTPDLEIRDVRPDECERVGKLMIEVYSRLDGFPTPDEQPRYYETMANIGRFAGQSDTRVLVALTADGRLAGGVVYVGDMARYGSGGTAPSEKNASGMRLLTVDPACRGGGVGRALAQACIRLARERGHAQMILHTTPSMDVAWTLYQKLGFEPSADLDFDQEGLHVSGFRLQLGTA